MLYTYPITFYADDGTTVVANGELVTNVTLQTQTWNIIPAGNGDEYSGFPVGNPPAPTWATIPNFLNQNSSLSINILTTYVTPTSGVTLALNGTLPTGWAFSSATNLLTYNGTSVAGPLTVSFTATLTSDQSTSTSNSFTVSGVGSVGADVIAPTVPVGIAATNVLQTSATVYGLPSSDPSPAGAVWAGMKQYNVSVSGVAGSPFAVLAPDTGNQPIFLWSDIGSPGSAGSFSQSGADITLTSYGNEIFGTADQFTFAYQQVTGTSWVAVCKITSFANVYQFAIAGLMARTNLTPGSPNVTTVMFPFASDNGFNQSARISASATTANQVSDIPNTTAPAWLFLFRSGDTYTSYYSLDGNTLVLISSVTVVMGSTIYVGPALTAGNPAVTNVQVACDFTQMSIQTDPNWSLNLTGLSGQTSYPVSVTAQDGAGNVSAASTTFDFVTGGSSAAKPFPRFCLVGNSGAQVPNASTYNAFAQYPLLIIGRPYEGVMSPTRQAIVGALKTQTQSGKNSVVPIVYQYEMLDEIATSGGSAPEWTTVTSAAYANWICYQLNASGTPTLSVEGSGHDVADWALNTVGSPYGSALYGIPSGLTISQWAAQYIWRKFITGQLTSPTYDSSMAAPSLDGIWLDNFAVQCLCSSNADWLRNGTNQGRTNAAAIAACTAAKAAVASAYALLDSTRGIGANTEFSSDVIGSGLDGSNIQGVFNYSCQEYTIVGNPSGANYVLNRATGGFASALTSYQSQCLSAKNGTCLCLGNYSLTDYATLRSDLCFITTCGNGYFGGGASSGINMDVCDPTVPSSWPSCDEFWGGSLELGGYLGAPASGSQGNIQTAAWSNGVFRRDFTAPTVGGASVFYNSTTSSQTVTPGSGFYHIRSTTGQSINSGAAVGSGTITLAAGDGCVLIKASPP